MLALQFQVVLFDSVAPLEHKYANREIQSAGPTFYQSGDLPDFKAQPHLKGHL